MERQQPADLDSVAQRLDRDFAGDRFHLMAMAHEESGGLVELHRDGAHARMNPLGEQRSSGWVP